MIERDKDRVTQPKLTPRRQKIRMKGKSNYDAKSQNKKK